VGSGELLNGSRPGLYILGRGAGGGSLLCYLRLPSALVSATQENSQRKENRAPCPLRLHPFIQRCDKVTVVPPRDLWPFSTITVDDLEALVADGLLRPLSSDP
jgi:hypothetical protein